MKEDVKFVRIRGRIVPIKKSTIDKKIVGSAQVAGGLAVSAASGAYAAKLFKQSYSAYKFSAHMRGLSKVFKSQRNASMYASAIKDASKLKVSGKGLALRAFGIASLGSTIGSTLAGYGGLKLSENKEKSLGIASAFGAIGSGVGLAILARKANVGHIANAFKLANPKSKVSDAFKLWSSTGSMRTHNVVSNYSDVAKKINKANFAKYKQTRLF